MKKQVLFIEGGGEGGHEADAKMVAEMQDALGAGYEVIYPTMQTDEALADFGWIKQIGVEIGKLDDGAILVAHSLGASLLLKYLAENKITRRIPRIFLLSTPFWTGNEDWKQGFKLSDDFAAHLPTNITFYFYQCKDDEEVPMEQLDTYRQKLPSAAFHVVETGGHQFAGSLGIVADNIKAK